MRLHSIIGDEGTYTIEHRVLNTVLVFGIAITVIAGILNYAIDLTLMAVVSLACGMLLVYLHYLSLRKKQYELSLYVATLIIFLVTPILWIFNGGITGGTPFYIIMFASMIAVAVAGNKRNLFIACLVIMSLFLVLLQNVKPWWHTGYVDDIVRVDNSVGLLLAIIVNAALYVTIMNQYNKEHAKSEALFAQLEKQKMEITLNRLDRLRLVGEMAASIGHEIRNPLTTVRGFLQLFQSRKEYAGCSESFELVIQELDRANSIISEFLALAKNKRVDLKRTNLKALIMKIGPLIQAIAIKEDQQLQFELKSEFDIWADENEIKQLVLNLAKNAIEATPKGGDVRIGMHQENNQGVLVIQDSGSGIPPEVYERLGAPFLTTKAGGTGLGLPICFSIADRHKAVIQVETNPRGTVFSIRFDIV